MPKPATERTIAIIGAGIVGVQIARTMQANGYQVTLFDKGEPGMATSFGNAGFIASDEIFPLAHGRVLRSIPRMVMNPLSPLSIRWQELPKLIPWFIRYANACSTHRVKHSIRALAALQAHAAPAWRRCIKQNGIQHLIRDSGAWKLFESTKGFSNTQAERATQKQFGIVCEIYSGAELRERLPDIGSTIKHGVFYPGGMSVINSLLVTEAIVSCFVEDGGDVRRMEVTSIDSLPRGRVGLNLADGNLQQFDLCVIASGHTSGRLLEPLGYPVPIVAERGYHLEVAHSELSFDMPVGLHERGFYMTPMTTGLRLAGTTEFVSANKDPAPNWQRAELLRRHVDEILPGVAQAETGRWMGHRPTLYDFLPVLGKAPRTNNIYLAFGHHHLGLTLSAVSAEILLQVINDEQTPIDIQAFSLARFQAG